MKKNIIQYLKLLVVSSFIVTFMGCEDDNEVNIVNPHAEFIYEISTVDPFEYKFTSTITDRDSLRWEFGDGESSTKSHPTHTFPEEGEYTITLTAYGEAGSTPAIIDTVLNVERLGPTAEFSASASTDNPLSIKFKSSSTYARSFAWDFGDGNTSTEENPIHIYEAEGMYSVTLTVTGIEGTTPVSVSQSVSAGVSLTKLEGTIFGHEGSWDGENGLIGAAFDGDLGTFVDAASGSGGYVGYDLGEGMVAKVKLVKYAPREGQEGRIVGAEIRGTNDVTILTDPASATYETLYTFEDTPTAGVLSEAEITGADNYRFIYYYSAPDGYCNVAELEFYGDYPFDGGLIDMNNWTVQVVTPGITVNITDESINFSGGASDWPGSHIYQQVTVEAGTYQLTGSLTVNSVINETWSELIFSSTEPQDGVDYAPGIPYQVVYSTWNSSPTDPGTYDLIDFNKGGEYPEDGLYTYDAPETFYIVIKSGAAQPYDLTWNQLAFKKVE